MATVTELAKIRQKLWDIYNSREVDNEKIDLPEFEKVIAIEARIAKASFKTRADKIAGNKILMEDKPNRWDGFQEALFLRTNSSPDYTSLLQQPSPSPSGGGFFHGGNKNANGRTIAPTDFVQQNNRLA